MKSAYLLALLGLLCLVGTKPASADSYSDLIAGVSAGTISNIGFTGNGRSLVLSMNTGGGCGPGIIPCYIVFTPATGATLSDTLPPLTDGDGPRGYSLFTATPTDGNPFQDLFVSHDGSDTLIYEGDFGNTLVNSYGDVAFIAYNSFEGFSADSFNVLAVNEAPEPPAFILLATGIMGMLAFTIRKRSVAHL